MSNIWSTKTLTKKTELSTDVHNLKTKSSDVISCHHLGFQVPEEAHSWVEYHCPSGRFGLVIDFHTMMENIYQQSKELTYYPD